MQIEEKTNGFEIFTNVITDVAKNRCSWCIFNAHKKDCCRDCRNANNFIFKTEKVFDKYEELVKFLEEKNGIKMNLEEIKKKYKEARCSNTCACYEKTSRDCWIYGDIHPQPRNCPYFLKMELLEEKDNKIITNDNNGQNGIV